MLLSPIFAIVASLISSSQGSFDPRVQAPVVVNSGFEQIDPGRGFASHWNRGISNGTAATAEIDGNEKHTGTSSVRITDATPTAAYKYAIVNSDWIDVKPSTTYQLRFWVKGKNVGKFMAGAGIEGAGEYRIPIPVGDYDWREFTFRITTPENGHRVTLQFVADGASESVWIDDVSLSISDVQLANIKEVRSKPFAPTWFPRTPGPISKSLFVVDISHESTDTCAVITALQGIVNRKQALLYLINPTNPARYDTRWLEWLKKRGYTGREQLLHSPSEAIAHFRTYVSGVVMWDPNLPGSINAAWMLAGLRNGLPCSPTMSQTLQLPILEDLRGKWKRNVDAYRWIYDHYWPQMSHNLLAWEYPGTNALSSRDYMVQQKVFLFWVSSPSDREPGADPQAEMEFAEDLLRNTPGNTPVMGWPMYGTKGVDEYAAVRTLSEFAKWVPGTGYNSNVTVHSAVQPSSAVFKQHPVGGPAAETDPNKGAVNITLNIMDSGDAQWYWQLHQQRIWSDADRGASPTGYGMNPTVLDTMPAVAEWYYANRRPGDSLFGLIYMNAPIYGSRYRTEDRERIWNEYIAQFDRYRKALDMTGIELYNGGSAGPTATIDLIHRFTRGMPGLQFILADLGRHTDVTPANAAQIIDGVPVFHTLTNFRVWTSAEEVSNRTMADENHWLKTEITSQTPYKRPAFMSALAISWYYFPSWVKSFVGSMPSEYRFVSPEELSRAFLRSRK